MFNLPISGDLLEEIIIGKILVGVVAILSVAEVILVIDIVVVQDCHHPRNIWFVNMPM